MAPAMDFIQWNSSDISVKVEVNCFLPTGVLVPIMSTINTSLAEIKRQLFFEARAYPLYKKLLAPANYNFICISNKGKRETIEDERLTLRDVRPFRPFLKLVERQGVREKEMQDSKIKFLMGKTPREFDATNDVQKALFRSKYAKIAKKISDERKQKEWDDRSICAYPPDLYDSNEIPKHIAAKLVDNTFLVSVHRLTENSDGLDFHAFRDGKPSDVLAKALQIKAERLRRTVDEMSNFTLKIKGKESYLLGNFPLLQYKYIRDCIAREVKPELSVVPKSSLKVEDYAPMVAEASSPPPIPPKVSLTVWDISSRFKFKIASATNISIEAKTEIGVRAGLYHGSMLLCPVKCSREKQGPAPVWNEYLEFDISMCDIPRMAKLCLTIYAKRKKDSKIPLAWVNMTLFDFRNYLRQGQIILHAWPVKDNFQDLNPIGTVVSNINTSTSACLIIEFSQYARPGTSVVYPPFDKVLEKASTLAGNEQIDIFRGGEKTNIDLQLLTQREPLAEYTEHEKKKIWFFRFECRDNFPNSLPKVLLSIQWNNHEDVARMHALLQCWPRIAPEQALELLDYKYPEKEVRDYAVQCLENFSDGQLHMYLLQLVQVLKYEAYLDCHLAKFLLRRALWNRKIGHSLFWLLRAEMHVPEVSVRFGLLLEAYCRGCVTHMASLSKQVEAMNKLKAITELLQCTKRTDREKCIETMKECLHQVTFREAFSDFHSVVDPTCKLKSLRIEGCNVMDSKMRPLWMVFENDDEMGAPTTLIFKNGDDLRQDMLTLQIFKIMDTLWQREGLNLQMTPYAVLPTGDKIGVIDVVTKASTLANIQKSEGGVVRGAFKKEVLLGWLKGKNHTNEMLKRAVEAFTMSCAGYCVATYVLGVGDRHSDNIMVKETGQLVHIDFGHFLGNFKVKFGVNRERVPFILSRDFVYVITNGQKSDKCSEFLRFREICERAYLILRKHNYLFINLFTMMLSTGLPELRSVKDIEYLKKTLGLNSGQMNAEEAEKAALLKFRKCFDEAYKNSTSTSLNWAIHNWAKDNK